MSSSSVRQAGDPAQGVPLGELLRADGRRVLGVGLVGRRVGVVGLAESPSSHVVGGVELVVEGEVGCVRHMSFRVGPGRAIATRYGRSTPPSPAGDSLSGCVACSTLTLTAGRPRARRAAAAARAATCSASAGAPGAGKSRLAGHLARPTARWCVPMDGFHLADVELARRGLLDRKGAPDSFDAGGTPRCSAGCSAGRTTSCWRRRSSAGSSSRSPGAIPVPSRRPALVVTEGNYLLLDEPRGAPSRERLDAVWHVVTDDRVRPAAAGRAARAFGKSPEEARAWVERVDQPNAAPRRGRARAGRPGARPDPLARLTGRAALLRGHPDAAVDADRLAVHVGVGQALERPCWPARPARRGAWGTARSRRAWP